MTTSEPTLKSRDEQPYVAIPIQVALKEWSQANALVPDLEKWSIEIAYLLKDEDATARETHRRRTG